MAASETKRWALGQLVGVPNTLALGTLLVARMPRGHCNNVQCTGGLKQGQDFKIKVKITFYTTAWLWVFLCITCLCRLWCNSFISLHFTYQSNCYVFLEVEPGGFGCTYLWILLQFLILLSFVQLNSLVSLAGFITQWWAKLSVFHISFVFLEAPLKKATRLCGLCPKSFLQPNSFSHLGFFGHFSTLAGLL